MKHLSIFFGLPVCLLLFAWIALGCPALRASTLVPAAAITLDVILYALFCFLHSALAQAGTPRHLYLTLNALYILTLFWLWESTGVTVWDLGWRGGNLACLGLYWLALVAFIPNLSLLLGMREPGPAHNGGLVVEGIYRYVRHPLHVALLLFLFVTPRMTLERLLVACTTLGYLAVAIPLEERKLLREFPGYAAYKRQTWWVW